MRYALVALFVLTLTVTASAQPADPSAAVAATMAQRYGDLAKWLAACDANLARQSTFTQEAQAQVKELEAKLAELPERSGNESRD